MYVTVQGACSRAHGSVTTNHTFSLLPSPSVSTHAVDSSAGGKGIFHLRNVRPSPSVVLPPPQVGILVNQSFSFSFPSQFIRFLIQNLLALYGSGMGSLVDDERPLLEDGLLQVPYLPRIP